MQAGSIRTSSSFSAPPAPGGFPSVNGECTDGEITEIDFVAFGREPDVSPNGRYVTFVSDKDLNGDQRLTVDNTDGGDEIFRLNRKPSRQPNSFCLGGVNPGLLCVKQKDCAGDVNQDPIVNDGVCVLLTQLTNDTSGTAVAQAPRPTRRGDVFFSTNADLLGGNPDASFEVHTWLRRDFRRTSPTDPNAVVNQVTDEVAGIDSTRPEPDRGGRRVVMQSEADPLGTNADGNIEIFLYDSRRNVWTQITDSTGVDNMRPSTHTGRQVLFDSTADYTGANPDGNREVFLALFKRRVWNFTQITDTIGLENRAGHVAKRGKIITFSSTADLVPGSNPDGNREIFLWERGVVEQVTSTTVGENVNPYLNPRGRFLVFESTADVEDGGTGGTLTNRRVHLFDRKLGTTLLISRSFFGDNFTPRISNGRFVVWESNRRPDRQQSQR